MKPDVQKLIQDFADAHDQGKALMDKANRLCEEIAVLVGQGTLEVGDKITLSDGRNVWIVDNFAKANLQWRPAPFRRFELSAKEP